MIDHISLGVADLRRSRAFYDAVLGALGIERAREQEEETFASSGYGEGDEPPFWIGQDTDGSPPPRPGDGTHIAFAAGSRAAVDAFHRAALAAGGRDNGAPGLRPHYHRHYYAAFVIDPDGHHLEAVCHEPPSIE